LDTLTPFRRFENRYFFIIFSEKTVFGLSEFRKNAKKKKKKKKKKEMVRNVILRILSTHTSKSAENRPRKIDFTIFAVGGVLAILEVDFGGRNFKSAKQGQSVPKSRKSRFRDNTSKTCRKFRRTTSDPQKNV